MAPGRPDDYDDFLHINLEMKTKRMTLVKLLSFKRSIILLSIWLFILGGYSETLGAGWLFRRENLSAHCNPGEQDIVYASKRTVRGWIAFACKEKFTIEMGTNLTLRKRSSRSENITTILFIFMVSWGIAILFVLGVILYQIVIQALIKKGRWRSDEMQ
jgi:hypothetical protein